MQTIIVSTLLFLIILLLGYVLAMYLSKKRGKSFDSKELRRKMLLWVPIYALFALFVISNQFFQFLVAVFIGYNIVKEVRSHLRKGYPFLVTYFALAVGFGLVAIWIMAGSALATTVAVVFATMLSEEFGYFAHSYSKNKKKSKNSKYQIIRSKESIVGQATGVLVGSVATYFVVGAFDLWISLAVFIGVVLGDSINRYVKSKLRITTWSNRLKNHGGYLDRFAGLSFAAVMVYVFYFF